MPNVLPENAAQELIHSRLYRAQQARHGIEPTAAAVARPPTARVAQHVESLVALAALLGTSSLIQELIGSHLYRAQPAQRRSVPAA